VLGHCQTHRGQANRQPGEKEASNTFVLSRYHKESVLILWFPFSSECWQVHIPKLPTPESAFLFCYCAKLSSPLHHVDCPNGLQAAHKFLSFYAVQGLNVFSDLPKYLPQKIGLPCFSFCFFHWLPIPKFIKLVKFFISLVYFTSLVM